MIQASLYVCSDAVGSSIPVTEWLECTILAFPIPTTCMTKMALGCILAEVMLYVHLDASYKLAVSQFHALVSLPTCYGYADEPSSLK